MIGILQPGVFDDIAQTIDVMLVLVVPRASSERSDVQGNVISTVDSAVWKNLANMHTLFVHFSFSK